MAYEITALKLGDELKATTETEEAALSLVSLLISHEWNVLVWKQVDTQEE